MSWVSWLWSDFQVKRLRDLDHLRYVPIVLMTPVGDHIRRPKQGVAHLAECRTLCRFYHVSRSFRTTLSVCDSRISCSEMVSRQQHQRSYYFTHQRN